MPSIQNLVQENKTFRKKLKVALNNLKEPVEMPLWPLLYLGVKLLRHDEALELLVENEFGSEAGILVRTMFEAAVNIMWITKDAEPDQLIEKLKRYTNYQFVASEKYSDYVKKFGVLDKLPESQQREWKQIDDQLSQKARELKEEYEFSTYKQWSGKTLKEMANDVGWGERYATLYQMYSEIIHSGFIAVQDYLVFDKDGKITVNYKTQTEHCKACLSEGQVYLLTAFSMLNIFLDLRIDQTIEDAMRVRSAFPRLPWPTQQ